jgi:cytosolic carboxypeptidase protein 2/3
VKFNILNYSKGDSMFNYGMKVAIYSERKAAAQDVGWHRGGTDISYFKNNIRKDYNAPKYFYTATFTHTFEFDDDSVFFSYSYPYTLTDLRNDLEAI